MNIVISRVAYNATETMGVLKVNNVPRMLTLEDPWQTNKTNISCIPQGSYTCKPYQSPKYPNTFEVIDVPGRDYILFHKGNTNHDTHGCILVGRRFGSLHNENAILESTQAFGDFLSIVQGLNEFNLTIE